MKCTKCNGCVVFAVTMKMIRSGHQQLRNDHTKPAAVVVQVCLGAGWLGCGTLLLSSLSMYTGYHFCGLHYSPTACRKYTSKQLRN